jgi:hypothetical protein
MKYNDPLPTDREDIGTWLGGEGSKGPGVLFFFNLDHSLAEVLETEDEGASRSDFKSLIGHPRKGNREVGFEKEANPDNRKTRFGHVLKNHSPSTQS